MHISVTFDPLNKYPPDMNLLEACGFLPEWVINPEYHHLPLREAMEVQYGLGPLHEIRGVTITGTYAYQSQGDPPLFPLVIITRGDEVFVEYPYGLVAFTTPTTNSAFVTRMD